MKKLSILLAFFVFVGFTLQAQMQITGTVTSAEDGQSIPGVSVVVKGQETIGTTTDIDGNYSLTVPSNAEALIFTFVGMKTKEEPINGRTVINVAMETEVLEVDEVIVVAYGTAKKETFTGSAETIKADQIEKVAAASVTKALEGTAPGVQVSNNNGQPGSGVSVRIRGITSVNGSSSPLYVVDGTPYDGNINAINPDDIATITVLKEATSTALYGARAANGVIMITTKQGSKRNSYVKVKASYGLTDRALPEYPRVNEQQYYEYMWEAYRNQLVDSGVDPTTAGQTASNDIVGILGGYNSYDVADDQLIDPSTGKLNPNATLLYSDDWQEELFQVARRSDYMLSIGGGSDNSDYYLSMGYLDEEGIVKNSDFQRITTRLNLNTKPYKWLEAGLGINASFADQNFFLATGSYTTNPFYYSRMMGPIYPVYKRDANGDYQLDDNGERILDYGDDPAYGIRPYAGNSNLVGTLALDDRSTETEDFGARAYIQFNILEGLTFKTSLNADYYNQYQTTFQNPEFGDAANVSGRLTKDMDKNLSYTFNQILTYDKSFGEHNIELMAGHENYALEFQTFNATRTGFPFTGIVELSVAAVGEGSGSYTNTYNIEGYFARLNYDFRNRYYLSASFRRDGSSRFHQDARWGNFYSIGGSWRITQEEFLKGIPWLNNLKLKASYGEQGNDGIGTYYAWQSFYALGWDNAAYNGAILSTLENTQLQWETTKNTNVGLEFTLFERVMGEFNYFTRKSENLLFQVPLAPSTGIDQINQNAGTMQNTGFEFQVQAFILKDSEFKWDLNFNITHFKNEITELPEEIREGFVSGSKRWEEGHSVYDYYLYEYAGVDPTTGEALYWADILDANGDPTGERETVTNIANATKYYTGDSALPDYYGGLTNTFSYKGLELSVLFTYSIGGKLIDYTYRGLMHEGDAGTHWHVDIEDRWQQSGDVTDVPRLEMGNTNVNPTSDRWLTDATYFNLKNIQLAYNLPRKYTDMLRIENLKLFVSADNLKIWSDREGMDPQQGFEGASDYTYVPVKVYSFGLNVSF